MIIEFEEKVILKMIHKMYSVILELCFIHEIYVLSNEIDKLYYSTYYLSTVQILDDNLLSSISSACRRQSLRLSKISFHSLQFTLGYKLLKIISEAKNPKDEINHFLPTGF